MAVVDYQEFDHEIQSQIIPGQKLLSSVYHPFLNASIVEFVLLAVLREQSGVEMVW